jgi:glyoxylase-like metal-dependent hydrolase (beta-lactamase superfamily II)
MRVRDTCNVWVIPTAAGAVCIDFGSGLVLDRLEELGIERITDVLVTHHHRDGVQGLERAVAAGARVWVPPVEEELIASVDTHWQSHRADNDYDLRQHRFSLREPVAVTGVVAEYRARDYGGVEIYTLPTPGHTIGSVTYLVELEGGLHAFTGDLLYAPGKVWSLAALQWTYTGVEGHAAQILSCGVLARRRPDVLLPAHGEPIDDPPAALARTQEAVGELMELRRDETEPWELERWLDDPWEALSPHLLRNRTSFATSYALLSDTGHALVFDWGYDLWTGMAPGFGRSTCRPRLESIDALRRNHGVEHVDAVVCTHYHDDHVAGINLLRAVQGVEAWAPANVAPILEDPHHYDLPCLWFEPIPVDRVLPLEQPIPWHEHELTLYALPGHTLYAAAISFEVDGTRVLITGDQQGGGEGERHDVLNYQYRNRFRIDDYVASAELYARLRPEVLLTGHWAPRRVTDEYLAALRDDGRRVADLHRELLPLDDVDFGAEGFGARMAPYRTTVARGHAAELVVEVRNPFARDASAQVRLGLPQGWTSEPDAVDLHLPAHGEARASFHVTAAGPPRLVVIAADLTVDGQPFGEQAEALVTVT